MLMYSAYTYQHLIHINCMLFKTKKINMKLGFFSSFPISEKQHAYTNIILTKLHVTQPRNNHANWIFSRFPALKKSNSKKQYAYTNIILTKTTCYSTQGINMQHGFFFSSFQTKKHHAHKNQHNTKFQQVQPSLELPFPEPKCT